MEKEELARQNQLRDEILKAVLRSDVIRAEVQPRITRGDDLESILETVQELSRRGQDEKSSSKEPLAPAEMMEYEMENIANQAKASLFAKHKWTTVIDDLVLINHLFELYFTWVHPIHMLFSESLFREGFQSDRTGGYCTSALVNVICAVACDFLQSPAGDEAGAAYPDIDEMRESLAVEGRALIKSQDEVELTRIQAIAVLALSESNAGQGSRAASLIKLASIELLRATPHVSAQDDVWEISSWGILSLKIAWAEFTYEDDDMLRLPNARILNNVRSNAKERPWRFYRQQADDSLPSRPSLAILLSSEFARFLQIIQDTNAFYYTNRAAKVTAKEVLSQHVRKMAWKTALPHAISEIGEDLPSLPHTFFLHIHYHTAIVQLFRPLVPVEADTKGEMRPSPRALCLESARIGRHLLEQYRNLYTFRLQSRLQVLCMVHICDCLVRFGTRSEAEDAASFCMRALDESGPSHGVCGPLQELFRHMVVQSGIELAVPATDAASNTTSFTLDEIMDACTRLTYAQPVEQVRRRLSPEFIEKWNEESMQLNSPTDVTLADEQRRRSTASAEMERERERSMGISSILNQ
ncbi:MAG: hypothetical protein M4579_006230 [Chaenotheca gracillima]|nr:MAG: hypothetical protein M4579_006230 [Chaenotheca gracillima]